VTIESLLTKNDLAEILRMGIRTLDRHRSAGDILNPLPGPGQPRWDPDEVIAWIKAGRPAAERWKAPKSRR
jgi:hypothetical protein